MNSLKYILLSLFLFLLNSTIYAQAPLPSFHPPSKSELAISAATPYIILHDYGQVSFEVVRNELLVKYDYYRRIKIINPQEFSPSELIIEYGGKDKQEELLIFEGYIYSTVNGEIAQTTIKPVESWKHPETLASKAPIEMRDLDSGDIIEYTYTIFSDNFFELKTWDFQKYVPVLRSEYHTYIPEDYEYLATFQGNTEQLQREESTYEGRTVQLKGEQLNLPIQWQQNRLGIETQHRIDLSGTHTSLILDDIAPILPEPYMSSVDDFRVKFRQQLIQVNVSMTGAYQIIRSWKSMNERLLKHIHFGKRLKLSGSMRDQMRVAAKIETKGIRKDRDKTKVLYNYLRQEISWTGEYDIFSGSLRQAWDKKLGNSAEINLILVSLLRAADILAFPVLISTREHGKVNPKYPIVSQFNHVIVAVQLRGDVVLLDALSDVVEFGMLPRNDLNGYGFIVDERHTGIIELSPSHALMRNIYGRFSVNFEDEKMSGEMDITHRAYSAALERARLVYERTSTQNYIKTILSNSSEVEVSQLEIQHLEEWHEPLKVTYDVKVADHVKKINNLLMISPFSTGFFEYNPFQSENRQFPVDFSVPIQDSQTFVLEIPEGYEPLQIPENAILALPEGGGTFIFDIVQVANLLRVSSSLQINQTLFSTQEYSNLQSFFNFMIHKLDEDIILRKIQTQD